MPKLMQMGQDETLRPMLVSDEAGHFTGNAKQKVAFSVHQELSRILPELNLVGRIVESSSMLHLTLTLMRLCLAFLRICFGLVSLSGIAAR